MLLIHRQQPERNNIHEEHVRNLWRARVAVAGWMFVLVFSIHTRCCLLVVYISQITNVGSLFTVQATS